LPTRLRRLPRLAAHSARRAVAGRPGQDEIRLTIDATLQARLEALAAEHAAARPAGVSAAVLVADHGTGEILAAVGSAALLDPTRGGFVDMTRAPRSPGSTLKPLIYGLAFERGIAHPESLIEDRPTGFGGYVPSNFDRAYQGTVTVRHALQQSLNVPAVVLLDEVGPARLSARLRRAGVAPRLPDASPAGLAIGLGGLGLTLRDLVTVYAAIARGGTPVALYEERDPVPAMQTGPRVLDEIAAWHLASVLSGARRVDARGADVAVKTGTSYGYRDAWALGFDGRHAVGVWLGRPDGAAVPGLTGSAAAVPLLRDSFARLGAAVPLPAPPPGVLVATTAELPPTLARVRTQGAASGDAGAVEIAFPPPGATLDIGTGPLVLKVRNGTPPFFWLADDRPIAREPYVRETLWHPAGPGFARISVIDARGGSSRVEVRLE
jgi:penicillin-binding protein 1C